MRALHYFPLVQHSQRSYLSFYQRVVSQPHQVAVSKRKRLEIESEESTIFPTENNVKRAKHADTRFSFPNACTSAHQLNRYLPTSNKKPRPQARSPKKGLCAHIYTTLMFSVEALKRSIQRESTLNTPAKKVKAAKPSPSRAPKRAFDRVQAKSSSKGFVDYVLVITNSASCSPGRAGEIC